MRLQSVAGKDAEAVRRMSTSSADGIKVMTFVGIHLLLFVLQHELCPTPLRAASEPNHQVLDAVFGLPFEIKRNQKRQLSPYR
jgi:hypothetical protein